MRPSLAGGWHGRAREVVRRLIAAGIIITAACGRDDAVPGAAGAPAAGAGSPSATGAGDTTTVPDDGMWPMPARNYASTRYSGLTEITTANVANLRLAWTFSTGVLRGHEAAPLVVGSTMYLVTPYPNILYAIDLTPPAGRL